MTHTQALRPGWTPLTIALMVLGFVVFWPLGLAMLAYIIWGDRLPEFRRSAEGVRDDFKRSFGGCGSKRWNAGSSYQSGNSAFDAYRAAELKRLEEERRKLDSERAEFEAFMTNLRRARDQEEFDRFKADRSRARQAPASETRQNGDDTVIDL
ncbi:DUF2852 domain-containing protein [Mesorhizobium sp. BR1-1-16]|jgi:hypothetical protein|uniref:DUF2852 domain-containing protein n=1 Tax=Mesorhizobium sp. BR1-1-16 TaxID=2876653 RepID=UPI001CC9E826|nr:DUF2852 domain-containing protein [Mesorhizobium sp. BR1-1-16]MBZ9937124.1 DUF2852 domain-containing protein [Mesorhizobium sp. BR1-1-16]HWJ74039.1 DUF2852 domain-containing protein [Kaistia sp.]